jgi:RNA ligase
MSYPTPKNPNYVATVISVPPLESVEGLDNLLALRMLGMQALVGRDTQPGTLGLLFSTEVQLSEEFAKQNNLHRHSDLNADQTKVGYLEDSRRVKAIRLRGVRSDSLFLPLSSLDYLRLKNTPREGDVFDVIDGHEICKKYQIKEPKEFNGPKARVRRVDLAQFPTHLDTENWWRNEHKVPDNAHVVITQKLHGTSVRLGRVLVNDEKPSLLTRLASRLGVNVKTDRYRFVVGSRMVVKSVDLSAEEGKTHYYGEDDVWTQYADTHRLSDKVPDGFLVYGELVGYTPSGKIIQPKYAYEQSNDAKLYVYRVAVVLPNGRTVDLSWPEVRTFCEERGLATVPQLGTGIKGVIGPLIDGMMDGNYRERWLAGDNYDQAPVALSHEGTVDEGVCVRYDGPNGVYILKAKSPIFLGHESALLDKGDADIESEESA